MRVSLKPFQEDALNAILSEVESAKLEVSRNRNQAVILSSPTGSGKTVTMAAVIEAILFGIDGVVNANPAATFLWFSDSPELNEQSREKIARAADLLTPDRLVAIDASFDQSQFQEGSVYFLNTQKLARTSLLLRRGDTRRFTIWDTVRNSIDRFGGNLILIIDEAHRGMTRPTDIAAARTIIQKFVVGSEETPAVPLILGMSATPQRFDALLGSTNRVRRPVTVDPADVRASGLLKERIVLYHPNADAPKVDYTLLRSATRAWRDLAERWSRYCAMQSEALVRPLLVVQVEDGNKDTSTRTDLEAVVSAIREEYPALSPEGIVHCFESDSSLDVGGFRIRKVRPSSLDREPFVEVVLFKLALTTGWDCPRAEVMMSFRKALDYTLIAQLVGRMVRAPLARRVECDERLNDVELFLPHFDSAHVDAIVALLSAPDPADGVGIRVQVGGGIRDYRMSPASAQLIPVLSSLPSYVVENVRKIPAVKRLLRLAFQLGPVDGIVIGAYEAAMDEMLARILASREDLIASLGGMPLSDRVLIRKAVAGLGDSRPQTEDLIDIQLSSENIDQLFTAAARRLAPGEGLHMAYLRRVYGSVGATRGKAEFVVLANDSEIVNRIEEFADRKCDELFDTHKDAIAGLPEGSRDAYRNLQGVATSPKLFPLIFPEAISSVSEGNSYPRHLYSDSNGDFDAALNTWEDSVVREELANPEMETWLRTADRKPYSICVPYEDRGRMRSFYPDALVVRKVKEELVVDILEPHDPSRDDSWKKAKGLAEYAERHGHHLGRLLIGQVVKGHFQSIDANDCDTRRAMLQLANNDQYRDLLTKGSAVK